MFFNKPGKPTKFKKVIYLLVWTILGFLLGVIGHALIEINYLYQVLEQGQVAQFYGNCALPPVLQIALLVIGVVGGFFLGRFFWRKVYLNN